MRPRLFRDPGGGTLIEVLVALVLLGGGIVGAVQMTRMAQAGLDSAKHRVLALSLAQTFLEERAAGSPEALLNGPAAGTESIGGMMREWTVSSAPTGLGGAVLRVTVQWTDRRGQEGRVTLKFFMPEGRVP